MKLICGQSCPIGSCTVAKGERKKVVCGGVVVRRKLGKIFAIRIFWCLVHFNFTSCATISVSLLSQSCRIGRFKDDDQ